MTRCAMLRKKSELFSFHFVYFGGDPVGRAQQMSCAVLGHFQVGLLIGVAFFLSPPPFQFLGSLEYLFALCWGNG